MSKNYLENNIDKLKELNPEELEKELDKFKDNIVIDANYMQQQLRGGN